MCGILGTTKSIDESVFRRALDLISYRGPDDSSVLVSKGILLGHKRLSILDLSVLGRQPMVSATGENIIVFNGEIYNFKELRKDLVDIGTKFKSNSDTEVILEGYEKEGVSFFKKLRGMWAFAIFDIRQNKIILSRDFFGIKPLYYSISDKELFFSSELKPLSLMVCFTPDKSAYEKYFSLGAMFLSDTGIKDVFQILPGEVIEFDIKNKILSKKQLLISKNSTEHKDLEEVLSDSVKAHYVADVPVSILFSGGLDSTLIAALSKKEGYNPTCFFVEIEDSVDKNYAKSIAEKLGLPFESIKFDNSEFHNTYNKVLSDLDIPTSDFSILPTYSIFNKIKDKTKVALSGEGGDELFGGYLRHKDLFGTSLGGRGFTLPKFYPNSILGLLYIAPIFSRIQKLINSITKNTCSTYALSSSTIYDATILKRTIKFLNNSEKSLPWKNVVPDSLLFDLSLYLPSILMVKGDRASMMNSVEGRVPFLDKNVFDYVANKYRSGNYDMYFKKEVKKILEQYLPKDLIYRKKQGFGISNKIFLQQYVKEDFIKAFIFHKEREELFGPMFLDDMRTDEFYNIIMKKYPRFAFSLISSFYVWKNYGL